MRIMIRCDMEGVTGVVSYVQAEPGGSEYAFGRRMFMSDLLACVEGLREGGAADIVIYDEHYYGRNIDLDRLPDGVTAVCGKPPYRRDWAGGLDASFGGLVLLGFHSKFGTRRGLLHHSYELDIRGLRLCGVSVGEIGMETAIAGDFGVPLILFCGDSAGADEARALVPGVRTAVVKDSVDETGAVCYPAGVTAGRIRSAAREAAREGAGVRPWRVGAPARLEVTLNDGAYLDAVRRLCADRMVDERTLCLDAPNATAVWAEYWALKLRCQAAVRQAAGSAFA